MFILLITSCLFVNSFVKTTNVGLDVEWKKRPQMRFLNGFSLTYLLIYSLFLPSYFGNFTTTTNVSKDRRRGKGREGIESAQPPQRGSRMRFVAGVNTAGQDNIVFLVCLTPKHTRRSHKTVSNGPVQKEGRRLEPRWWEETGRFGEEEEEAEAEEDVGGGREEEREGGGEGGDIEEENGEEKEKKKGGGWREEEEAIRNKKYDDDKDNGDYDDNNKDIDNVNYRNKTDMIIKIIDYYLLLLI